MCINPLVGLSYLLYSYFAFFYYTCIFYIILAPICRFTPLYSYNIKYFTYIYVILVLSVLLLPIFAIRPRKFNNVWIFASILHYATRILNIDIRYSGNTDILLQEGPCVLILNHQSCLDILPLCKIIPTNIICMAKQSLIYAGAFGFCCALSGSILINRKLKQRTDFANICAKQILDKNLKLIIFPEGTRNSSGEILPFKCGAFNIAVSGKIPIIPVVISPYHFIDHDNKTFKYGIVNVNILPQINTYDMTLEDVPSLCSETRNKMIKAFKQFT